MDGAVSFVAKGEMGMGGYHASCDRANGQGGRQVCKVAYRKGFGRRIMG